MNKQRNVVYGKRNHALFGERLALDLDNSFYSVSEGLINSYKEANDIEGFKLAVILNYGMDTAITADDLEKQMHMHLPKNYIKKQLYITAKKEALAQQTMPIITNIRKEQGNHIENVAVPFTDGKKGIQALANLDKYLDTNAAELGNALERSITLSTIDDA